MKMFSISAAVFSAILGSTILSACGSGSDADTNLGKAGSSGQADGGVIDGSAPVIKETCGNGIDENRDGRIDEGCSCSAGSKQPCYPGSPETRNKGLCKDGEQSCSGGTEFAQWGDCVGAVTPKSEVAGDGKDNDCNQNVDEVTTCAPGEDCTIGEYLCGDSKDDDGDGFTDCQDKECKGVAQCPGTEVCGDNKDNNGDGKTDCDDTQCKGTSACPSTEVCNDFKDNNKDGKTDCDDTQCVGTSACPGTEVCGDKQDNNGDGKTDCDDAQCKGTSSCPGTEICNDNIDNDDDWLTDCKDPDCGGKPGCPDTEVCDGKDNDGDGVIDNGDVCRTVGEPCPPGAYKTCDCYCGVHRKCQADGTWGPCFVDVDCSPAPIITQEACPDGYCDYGECSYGDIVGTGCLHHSDCPLGQICDLGDCIPDGYNPGKCN